MLCFARGLVDMTVAMRRGDWRKAPAFALREATVGIVGVGNVGRAVARRVRAFGATLLGAEPVMPPDEVIRETGIRMTTLDEVLRASEFITTHCDLNPTSIHLLNAEAFAKMRPTAFVINTARGPIIEEPALVDALRRGAIAGAALDVFEVEPLPHDSPLLAMPNVLLAAHNSNASPAAWENVHWNTIANVFRVLSGEVPDAVLARRA